MEVNIHEAKTHLSKLIERIVKIIRVRPCKRVLGHAAGKIRFTEGWKKPLTEAELLRLIGE